MKSHGHHHDDRRRTPPALPARPLPPPQLQQWPPHFLPPAPVALNGMNHQWPPPKRAQQPPNPRARPPWQPRSAPLANQFPAPGSHLVSHRTALYDQQQFARPPPPPQVDPEALWLSGYTDRHLQIGQSNGVEAEHSNHEAPLRHVRRRLFEMATLLDELEINADELVELEHLLLRSELFDGMDITRLKLQVETKKSRCKELRSKLERLENPKPLGLGADLKRDVVSFTRRIQKKKLYRQRRAEKLQAERKIRQGMDEKAGSANGQTEERVQPPSAFPPLESDVVRLSSQHQISPANPRVDHRTEIAGAQKVLLMLELREKRQDDEIAVKEKQDTQQAREQAMQVLSRKRRRSRKRKPRTNNTSAAQRSENVGATDATSASLPVPPVGSARLRFPPLTDPYPLDMETLIAMRRRWDSHLVPSTVNDASAIPLYFVDAPARPSAQWAHFLDASQTHCVSTDSRAVQ